MLTVEDLNLLPVWVDPQHLVATAKHIMAGHKLKALGVVANGKLLGAVTHQRLLSAPGDSKVAEHMELSTRVVDTATPIRELAALFVDENLEFALAVKGDKYLGIVTSNLLLKELRRSFDPLTGLPWSDQLRHWGTEQLQAGREITILFLDIDDFGSYNKRYGHIVGDRVLQTVARALIASTDPARDVVVRYGGDEFAIASLRHRNEAEVLSRQVQENLDWLIAEGSDVPVTFCMGVQGGKRTHERDNVHYAATLDNLINLASRDCLAQKASKVAAAVPEAESSDSTPAPEPEPESPPAAATATTEARPVAKVVGVYADEHAPTSLTTVILGTGSAVVSGVHQRQGRTALESVALATAKALERVAPERTFVLEEVLLSGSGGAERVVTVTGHLQVGGEDHAVAGVGKVQDDLYVAAAEALIHAFSV